MIGALPIDISQFYPVRIDWMRCMAELRRCDWTAHRVAVVLCADPTTVYAWEKGESKPNHAYGTALLAIHGAVCGPELGEKLYSESRARL